MSRLATAIILWAIACSTIANERVIGFVKTVSGAASIVRADAQLDALPGTPLYMNDTLKTDASSSMGVTFKDNTVMSFGSNTEVAVDEFLYVPGEDKLSLSASITKGTLEYISGVIAKLKPEAVSIKTPTGTIGVRGTRFLVKVDDLSTTSEHVAAIEGENELAE